MFSNIGKSFIIHRSSCSTFESGFGDGIEECVTNSGESTNHVNSMTNNENGSCTNMVNVGTNTDELLECKSNKKLKLGTYVIERTIGKGMFSSVKLARHTITGLYVAIKIVDKSRLNAENLMKVYRESAILKEIYHVNIVKLYQVMETQRLLCTVMEYIPNGEVFDYITNHGPFSEDQARAKYLSLVSAIGYVHSCGIVHRDLKAENLLLDANMNIKLVDFSFGTCMKLSNDLLTTWCGSPPYAAPEIFLGEPYDGKKADIWSLGVVLYVMVCGSLPFDASSLPHLKNQVLSASFRVPYWLSLTCEHLIRSMLMREPNKRLSTDEIIRHPWFDDLSGSHQLTQNSVHFPTATTSFTASVLTPRTSQEQHPVGGHNLSDSLSLFSNHESLRNTFLADINSNHGPLKSVSSNLAAELKAGEFNELVIMVMEYYGMDREQIFKSLKPRAYDHITATYLLLGEKLCLHNVDLSVARTLPLSLIPNSGAIDSLACTSVDVQTCEAQMLISAAPSLSELPGVNLFSSCLSTSTIENFVPEQNSNNALFNFGKIDVNDDHHKSSSQLTRRKYGIVLPPTHLDEATLSLLSQTAYVTQKSQMDSKNLPMDES